MWNDQTSEWMTFYSKFECKAEGIELTVHNEPGCKGETVNRWLDAGNMMKLPSDALKYPTNKGGSAYCIKSWEVYGRYVSFKATGWHY